MSSVIKRSGVPLEVLSVTDPDERVRGSGTTVWVGKGSFYGTFWTVSVVDKFLLDKLLVHLFEPASFSTREHNRTGTE